MGFTLRVGREREGGPWSRAADPASTSRPEQRGKENLGRRVDPGRVGFGTEVA